jgi:hypothetical protein
MKYQISESLKKVWVIAALAISMSACATDISSWKEEALLHDGSKVVVDRSVTRGGRHEIGQSPPISDQNLTFTMPNTGESVIWKDEFSKDLGSANFLLIQLDIVSNQAYLTATPAGCLSYNKWGRPNPPYVIFQYKNKEWKRIELKELPLEIQTPNLIISSPDSTVKRLGKNFVSVDMVRKINSLAMQAEYKTIVRQPVSGLASPVTCQEMVYYKGVWIGPGDSIGKRMMDGRLK